MLCNLVLEDIFLVEVYSGDSGCGGCTTINRGLLSLTLDFSEGAVTMIGDELLVINEDMLLCMQTRLKVRVEEN